MKDAAQAGTIGIDRDNQIALFDDFPSRPRQPSYGPRTLTYRCQRVRHARSSRRVSRTLHSLDLNASPPSLRSRSAHPIEFDHDFGMTDKSMADTKSTVKPSLPHPLLQSKSFSTPPEPIPRKVARPPTSFDEIVETSPVTQADQLPPPGADPNAEQPIPRSTRILRRLRFRPSDSTQRQENPPSRALERQLRKQQQEDSARRAKEHRIAQKEMMQEEKARKQWLGGLAWGFDPTAGQVPAQKQWKECCTSASPETSGSTSRSGEWGMEVGGPGREGRHNYGLLKSMEVRQQ